MVQEVHRWVVVDDLMICVTHPGSSQDPLWHSFARDLTTKGVTKCLAGALNGADVTSVQRKIVADALKSRNIATAAVTDDKIVRGFITAVSWMGVNIKAFSWQNLEEALEFLKVAPDKVARVNEELNRLRGAVAK